MRLRHVGLVVAGGVVAAVLGGCAGESASTVEVVAREFSYGPNEVRLERGKTYALHMKNEGALLHDWNVEGMPARDVQVSKSASHGGHGSGPAMHMAAERGMTSMMTFTPTEAGTYEAYCSEPGHREAGMTARVVVE